jgi:hypothetical protein
MEIEETFELVKGMSTKDKISLLNKLTVVSNIIKGAYRGTDNPILVAKDDLDILNGDKLL